MKRNLLLISNSTNAGEDYLAWPRMHIRNFLSGHGISRVLFVPYAGVNLSPEGLPHSFDRYEERVRSVFAELGIGLSSIHRESDPVSAVRGAEAVVVGGGNTFHLVKMMHQSGIMAPIRARALEGMPFVGWSAGANVACPTMKTTNDMPISEPPSFSCLNLVPFQINPHYLDAGPAGHGGETREQRILEFLAVNPDLMVAGLREGCLLHVREGRMTLTGSRSLRLFKHGSEPREIEPSEDMTFLLQ